MLDKDSNHAARIIVFVLCGLAVLLMLVLAVTCVVKLQKSNKEKNKHEKARRSFIQQEKQPVSASAGRHVAPPAALLYSCSSKKPAGAHWNDLKQIVNTSSRKTKIFGDDYSLLVTMDIQFF